MTLPRIDAMHLRRLGETADGLRDIPMKLIARDADGVVTLMVLPASEVKHSTDTPLADVDTASRVGDRRRVTEVVVKVGELAMPTPSDMDSVFWTESSVEKFLFPYYEHVRIFDEEYLARLKDDFRNADFGKYIVAIAHSNPSYPTLIGGPPPPPGGGGESVTPPGGSRPVLYLTNPPEELRNIGWVWGWYTPEEFRHLVGLAMRLRRES